MRCKRRKTRRAGALAPALLVSIGNHLPKRRSNVSLSRTQQPGRSIIEPVGFDFLPFLRNSSASKRGIFSTAFRIAYLALTVDLSVAFSLFASIFTPFILLTFPNSINRKRIFHLNVRAMRPDPGEDRLLRFLGKVSLHALLNGEGRRNLQERECEFVDHSSFTVHTSCFRVRIGTAVRSSSALGL